MKKIIIDYPVNGWCHMVSDNIEALHQFAQSNGIKRCWFQNKRGKHQPHYDVRESKREQLIKSGAISVSRKELAIYLKRHVPC